MRLDLKVMGKVAKHLGRKDRLNLLCSCKAWSAAVLEAMYAEPILTLPDSFELLCMHTSAGKIITSLQLDLVASSIYMGDLDSLLKSCTQLSKFRLRYCFHVSNILLKSLALNCPLLTHIDLAGCPVSDTFIPQLTINCQALKIVNFSFTNLSASSLYHFIANCPLIEHLDLAECKDSFSMDVLDLINTGMSRPLKYLNIRNTPITDPLLRFISLNCPGLQDIILESCGHLTDYSVMKLFDSCKKLVFVDLSFCDQITDVSLQVLSLNAASHGGSCLEELHLSACDLITPLAVHQIAQKCKNLSLLVMDGCEKIKNSFVCNYASVNPDEITCTLEREDIKRLGNHILHKKTPSGNVVPYQWTSEQKVPEEIHYKNHTATVIDSEPTRVIDSESAIEGNGHKGWGIVKQRVIEIETMAKSANRMSRTIQARTSMMNLKQVDKNQLAQAIISEKTEKIREKRKSMRGQPMHNATLTNASIVTDNRPINSELMQRSDTGPRDARSRSSLMTAPTIPSSRNTAYDQRNRAIPVSQHRVFDRQKTQSQFFAPRNSAVFTSPAPIRANPFDINETFIYSRVDRGTLLLKLSVEVRRGTHKILHVYSVAYFNIAR